MYKQQFAWISLSMEVVVPHHLIELSGPELMGDLVGAVAQGAIPAELNIKVNNPDVGLDRCPDVILRFWESRLAANLMQLSAAHDALKDAEQDDTGRLESPFLWWEKGTPVIEVESWFKGKSKKE